MQSRMREGRQWLGDRFATLVLWWGGLTAAERVLYRAMAFLAVGVGGYDWRLACIVTGVLFALVFFGFRLGREAAVPDIPEPPEG